MDINLQIQGIKSQIDDIKLQLENIEMQNNVPMMMNPIGDQLLNLSIQILNTGIQTFNVGKDNSMNHGKYYEKLQIILDQINKMINSYNMGEMQQQMMQQQMMQQQMMQQQMMQQQMMNAQAQANKQAAMNNILNNMGQGNNAQVNQGSEQNQPQQQSGGGFSVIFRASAETGPASAPIMIQCMPNEKVSTIIDRYRAKSGDKDPTKKFIFNAKNLAPSLTLSEAGIANNANIFVVATKGIKGAF